MADRLVYVIDDDSDMLRSTAFLLQSMGYGVSVFADGAGFLSVFPSLEPACILTDLRMPQVSGYELKAKLDERRVDWPVILMTSESGSETADEAAARGFAEYLPKPFAAEQLAAALEKAFAALGKSRA